MTEQDIYLIKLKSLGFDEDKIAKKLNVSAEEVRARWINIHKDVMDAEVVGYHAICEQFTSLAENYQSIGEALKEIGRALGDIVPLEELETLVTEDRVATLRNLRAHCIILKAFVPKKKDEGTNTSQTN